jgi:hypothetical protein
MEHGFLNESRFAHYYHQLFGKYPSETRPFPRTHFRWRRIRLLLSSITDSLDLSMHGSYRRELR